MLWLSESHGGNIVRHYEALWCLVDNCEVLWGIIGQYVHCGTFCGSVGHSGALLHITWALWGIARQCRAFCGMVVVLWL